MKHTVFLWATYEKAAEENLCYGIQLPTWLLQSEMQSLSLNLVACWYAEWLDAANHFWQQRQLPISQLRCFSLAIPAALKSQLELRSALGRHLIQTQTLLGHVIPALVRLRVLKTWQGQNAFSSLTERIPLFFKFARINRIISLADSTCQRNFASWGHEARAKCFTPGKDCTCLVR